jgi:hypothetical protein
VAHGSDYEECCILGCISVWSGKRLLTFRRNALSPFEGWRVRQANKQAENRKGGKLLQHYTASHPRREHCSQSPSREPHIFVNNSKGKKVKLSLDLTNKAPRHEDVWGSGCIDPRFLDLGTSWRWVVSFTPRPLYPRERAPGTHWIRGWVNPRAGLDHMEKCKFFTPPGFELQPLGRPARSQSLYRLRQ